MKPDLESFQVIADFLVAMSRFNRQSRFGQAPSSSRFDQPDTEPSRFTAMAGAQMYNPRSPPAVHAPASYGVAPSRFAKQAPSSRFSSRFNTPREEMYAQPASGHPAVYTPRDPSEAKVYLYYLV